MAIEIAFFGAGCFWGVEAEFSKIQGVLNTRVGYMGGNVKDPTYEKVCKGDTEHVEVVKVEFDSNFISYKDLLSVFWKVHDPTQLNRQGPDVGRQYRSVIFYIGERQWVEAEEHLEEEQEKLGDKKIVTSIEPAKEFYEAEENHQRYIEKTRSNVC